MSRSAALGSLLALIVAAPAVHAQGTDRLHFTAVNTTGMGDDLTMVATSHRDPQFVVVGTVNGKIRISEDGGATWQEFVVSQPRGLYYGHERVPDPDWEYGPGLPGHSPQLQSWLRQKGLHTAGRNLAEFLFQEGEKPVTINWIEVDWHNPNRLWVATPSGLFRSNDKGRTFVQMFNGYTARRERVVNAVATDPSDPKKVIIGTAAGVWVSDDGGISWLRTLNYYLRDSYVRELHFHPDQQGLVHAALAGSAMASPDAGENWITTHWHQWHPRGDVQSVSLGPGDLRLMGTRDGVWASFQGGEMGTWMRRGYRFPHTAIIKVLATNDPAVWYAMTERAVWVTQDSGINWRKVWQTGGREIPRWITAFNGDPDSIWMITNRQVYRIGTPPVMRAYDLSMRRSPRLLQVPDPFSLLRRTLLHHHAYFEANQDYRARATWAALVPTITASYSYVPSIESMNLKNFMYPWAPYTLYNRIEDVGHNWEVIARWDLSRLIFTRLALPDWGRIKRNIDAVRNDMTERVYRLYTEYLRIARILVYRPPRNLLAREFHEIRLQEIAAYLDVVSGGYWSQVTGGAL